MIINKTVDFDFLPKNTKLFIVLILIPFIFLFVNFMLKSKAYYSSLNEIINHDEVILYLGTPIESGYLVSGSYGDVETELTYSIYGPLDSADVYLYAQFINGSWVIQDLDVTVNSINKKIDALAMQ